MNICILYYDDFWGYEVGLALNQLREHNIIAAALENHVYINEAKQKLLPDTTIEQLNPDDIDLFIIPGGSTVHLYENDTLKNFVLALNAKNKYIAGICGGTLLMAKYGILENKKCTGAGRGIKPGTDYYHLFEKSIIQDCEVVQDGNLITSTGQGFIDLAVKLAQITGVFKTEEEALNEYKWLKNIKD